MQSFLISILIRNLRSLMLNIFSMPAYHTTQVQQIPSVGNMGVLALRGNTKGPAPQIQEEDIIGESSFLLIKQKSTIYKQLLGLQKGRIDLVFNPVVYVLNKAD